MTKVIVLSVDSLFEKDLEFVKIYQTLNLY